jgi:hypothetical protein
MFIMYRVYRLQSAKAFSLVVQIGSPCPDPKASIAPPPLGSGGTHSLGERGRGGANSDEGTDTLRYSIGRVNPSTLICNIYGTERFQICRLELWDCWSGSFNRAFAYFSRDTRICSRILSLCTIGIYSGNVKNIDLKMSLYI